MTVQVGSVTVHPPPYAESAVVSTEVPLEKEQMEQAVETDAEYGVRFWSFVNTNRG